MGRIEYLRLEKEMQSYQRVVQSWRFVDVSEEEKSRLKTQLTALETQFDLKKKDLNAVTQRLIESEFWPVLPKDVGVGVRGSVEELQGQVKGIYEAIEKLQSMRLSSSGSGSADPPMSSTPTEEADRPGKRRRLTNGDTEMNTTPTPAKEQVQHPALAEDLDQLKDRVLGLEDKLSDMQNELVQYDHTMLLSLQEEMDAKFEQYDSAPRSSLPVSAPPAPIVPATPQDTTKITELDMKLSNAGDEITFIANEVAQLIKRNSSRDDEMNVLSDENKQLKTRITLVSRHAKTTPSQ